MGRLNASTVMENMMAVMRLINQLAPSDHTAGRPVSVMRIAKMLNIDPERVRDSIRMLNACGTALEESSDDAVALYYIDYDENTDLVVPYRMDIAIDRTIGLTPREARALLTMFDIVGIDSDDPLAIKISGAIPRLTAQVVEGIEAHGTTPTHTNTLMQITDTITSHGTLYISYQGVRDREARTRFVIPQNLSYDLDESTWYLYGWCIDANGWRTFRLDRILTIEQVDNNPLYYSNNQNKYRKLIDNTHSFDNLISPLDVSLQSAQTATLAVHNPRAIYETPEWRGIHRLENPSDKDLTSLTEQDRDSGGYIATIPWMDDSPWLVKKIVSTLGDVEALRPQALCEAVAQEVESLIKLF